MKQSSDQNKKSRRRFLSLGFLGGAALISKPASAAIPESDDELVPMLTPDGKLVKVRKDVLERAQNRQPARNEDILKWSKAIDKSE